MDDTHLDKLDEDIACPCCALKREQKYMKSIVDGVFRSHTPPTICYKALSVYMKRIVLGRGSIVDASPLALQHKSAKKRAEQQEAFNLKTLSVECPDFIDCCVCFIFCSYYKADCIDHLIESLSSCNCDLTCENIRKMHDKYDGAPEAFRDRPTEEIFQELWENIFRVVLLAVNTCRTKRLTSAASSCGTAVRCHDDMKRKDMPYHHLARFIVGTDEDSDPTRVGEACCVWYMATKTIGPLGVLLSLYIAYPVAFNTAARSIPPEFIPFAIKRLHDIVGSVAETELVTERIVTETTYLVLILTLPYSLSDETASLFMGDHVQLVDSELRSLHAAVSRLPPSNDFLTTYQNELLDNLSYAIWTMHQKFNPPSSASRPESPLDSSPEHSLVPGGMVGEGLWDQGCTPYWDTAKYISQLQRTQVCSGPGCTNTRNKLKRCGNCGVVMYCSSYCQKAAWNQPDHPHKAICPHWSFLMHTWPILGGNVIDAKARRLIDLNINAKKLSDDADAKKLSNDDADANAVRLSGDTNPKKHPDDADTNAVMLSDYTKNVGSDFNDPKNAKRFKYVANRVLRALVIGKGYTEGRMAAILLQCV